MQKCYIDLHIHTALSPCSEYDMTPNNIVNMAILKELDFIAITDHNSAKNVEAVIDCAKATNLIVIPGMEVETLEEVHILCYFKKLENLMNFQNIIYNNSSDIKNRPEIFGEQLIFDNQDNIIDNEEKLLSTACSLSIQEVIEYVKNNDGAVIPAHIDRESFSILNTLGDIPKECNIKTIEISKMGDKEKLLKKYNFLSDFNTVTSSDAHRLGDILEREMYLELNEKSIECLFEKLRE